MEISIDAALCRRCGHCVTVCPSEVFTGAKTEIPQAANPEACIACGHCVDVCAGNAIRHKRFPAGRIHDIRQALLPRPESLLELIRSRRSNRTLTGRPIPEAALKDILEAARYAPTAENSRRVKVTVIASPDALQAIEDATMKCFLSLAGVLMNSVTRPLTKALLPDLYAEAPGLERLKRRWLAGERPCMCNAKALLVFSAPRGYDFGWQDCNLSYQNASLMA
ncbi:MAG: nitroreductase family protein, partial [Prevotellaceae bacterium]|nr:nitroreductase family protein [Prevotellaceae bacterium]